MNYKNTKTTFISKSLYDKMIGILLQSSTIVLTIKEFILQSWHLLYGGWSFYDINELQEFQDIKVYKIVIIRFERAIMESSDTDFVVFIHPFYITGDDKYHIHLRYSGLNIIYLTLQLYDLKWSFIIARWSCLSTNYCIKE